MTMADFLNTTDPANTLGYQIRRHALWFAIDQITWHKKKSASLIWRHIRLISIKTIVIAWQGIQVMSY